MRFPVFFLVACRFFVDFSIAESIQSQKVELRNLDALQRDEISGTAVAERFLREVKVQGDTAWAERVNAITHSMTRSSRELCRFTLALENSDAAKMLDEKNRRLLEIATCNCQVWLLEDRAATTASRPDPKSVTERILQLLDRDRISSKPDAASHDVVGMKATYKEQMRWRQKHDAKVEAGLMIVGYREYLYRLLHSEFQSDVTKQIQVSKIGVDVKEMVRRDQALPNEATLRSKAMEDFHSITGELPPWFPVNPEWESVVPVRVTEK